MSNCYQLSTIAYQVVNNLVSCGFLSPNILYETLGNSDTENLIKIILEGNIEEK